MCGILGYYNKNGIGVNEVLQCVHAVDKVRHRGPNSGGIALINTQTGDSRIFDEREPGRYISEGESVEIVAEQNKFDLFLGHRRLSIIDLSAEGAQPMRNVDGSVLIFNGEIYNHEEVKAHWLFGYKPSINSSSDTATILEGLAVHGEQVISAFNGMWSLVFWDNKTKSLIISRDRFGVKPLYCQQLSDSEWVISSELKQMTCFNAFEFNIDQRALSAFSENGLLNFDNRTLLSGVTSFPMSSLVKLRSEFGILKPDEQAVKYYNPAIEKRNINAAEAVDQFRELLTDAVRLRLISDVPWAIAISGGVDSSAIAFTVQQILGDSAFSGVSASFPGMVGDETEFIKIACDALNVQSHRTGNDLFNRQSLIEHLDHQDMPVTTTSFYAQWSVAKLAKENDITVILNGQGADEVFGGYHHHFYRFLSSLIRHGRIKQYLSEINAYAEMKRLPVNRLHQIIVGDLKLRMMLRAGLRKFGNPIIEKWYSASSLTESLQVDFEHACLPYYLRVDDTNMMAHSIESRHPFMDYRLVEFGRSLNDDLKIRDGWQKWLIREAIHEMPNALRWRKDKKGFTTPQDQIEALVRQDIIDSQAYLDALGVKRSGSLKDLSLAHWIMQFK
ncbi:MAG: asparagine synthase (glutamine-hydrolyzing) [Flavobacteriales bacterium]|nr:asparagine synthase (glutamine-hydrolyzing) [Flavobacteriales bacterium]